MEIHTTPIEGLLVLQPRYFEDERGYFMESANQKVLKEAGIPHEFVQDNESYSKLHVLRGLHFQKTPHAQGKLVRVVKGAVLDVAVDIRKHSPTFGQHFSIRLDDIEKKMFWIPAGFAHGFLSLAEGTIFQYKCTDYYHKESEGGIWWNDPLINIPWNIEKPVVSEKDQALPMWNPELY